MGLAEDLNGLYIGSRGGSGNKFVLHWGYMGYMGPWALYWEVTEAFEAFRSCGCFRLLRRLSVPVCGDSSLIRAPVCGDSSLIRVDSR